MQEQIKSTMASKPVRDAAERLESCLQGCALTPQLQLATIALLAVKQISVLPEDAHLDAGDMIGQMVQIGLEL